MRIVQRPSNPIIAVAAAAVVSMSLPACTSGPSPRDSVVSDAPELVEGTFDPSTYDLSEDVLRIAGEPAESGEVEVFEVVEAPAVGPVEPIGPAGEASAESRGVAANPPEDPVQVMLEDPAPSLTALARYLEAQAGEADDPMPFLMARTWLALVAADQPLGESLPGLEIDADHLVPEESRLLEGLAAFTAAVRLGVESGSDPRDAVVEAATALLGELDDRPTFRIAGADICDEVRSFGDVSPAPRRLPALRDREVLVYVPLEGLEWTEVPDSGLQRWRVRYQIELHQVSDGLVVMPGEWETIERALPRPIHDTHFWARCVIPGESLAAGRYTLKVRVEDLANQALAEQSLPLELLPATASGLRTADGTPGPR